MDSPLKLLAEAKEKGYIRSYSGVRITKVKEKAYIYGTYNKRPIPYLICTRYNTTLRRTDGGSEFLTRQCVRI